MEQIIIKTKRRQSEIKTEIKNYLQATCSYMFEAESHVLQQNCRLLLKTYTYIQNVLVHIKLDKP